MLGSWWRAESIGWTLGALGLMYLLLLASRALQVPAANREKKELEEAGGESSSDRSARS